MLRLLALLLFLLPYPALAGDAVKAAFDSASHGDWYAAIRNADASGNQPLATLMRWQYVLDSGSGASFDEISKFIAINPDWPMQKKLRVNAELALREGETSHADIIQWFSSEPPVTGIGKIALARALTVTGGATDDKIKSLVQEAWRNGDFDETHEKDILNSFGKMLSDDDHIARADRLLWEEKTKSAKRMLPLLSKDRQLLVNARIALISDKTLSLIAVARVPASLKDDPGLIYDRMQYRFRRDDDDGVEEMLLKAPSNPPYPEKWWKARETAVRTAIDQGHYETAEKLLARHGELTAREFADATWLSGWLQLEFLKNPRTALDSFSRMYESVGYPVSRARAAYWAGRAAEAAGDSWSASSWYDKAAAYPTTFYGQLGALKSSGSSALRLPDAPSIDSAAAAAFNDTEEAQALRLCIKYNARDLANRLISGLIEDGTPEEAALVAKLVGDGESTYLAVRAAKKAMQKNIMLIDSGYPRPKTPDLAIERPLALAVVRQESEFDPNAQSPSGARGLIQLMPRTAKETARKSDLRFDKKRLFEPDYNLRIGSKYLERMIASYDGSYVMAIAAYNAGPGNVRKWVRRGGTPGNDFNNAINWIEKIPFYETRNYVQRVMENLQVYRQIEGGEKLQIAEDLVR